MSQELSVFEKYLLSLKPKEAVIHVVDCLVNGEQDNLAWKFMEDFNGKGWSCRPEDLYKVVGKSLHSLSMKALVLSFRS